MKYIKNLFAIMFVGMLFAPLSALGATMQVASDVSITQGITKPGNLYLAGEDITVDDAVSGDVLSAGGNVLISGAVSQDILVIGGGVKVLGDSAGDVRVVAVDMLIDGNIEGDLIVVGGTVAVSPNVSIGGDVLIAGGQISFSGVASGNMKVFGGVVKMNGAVGGDLEIYADNKIVIGDGANIAGALIYHTRSEEMLTLGEKAQLGGEVVFEKMMSQHSDARGWLAFLGTFLLFKILACVVVALILTMLFKDFSHDVVQRVVQKPLYVLGKGFVAAVVAPVAAIMLLVTIFGIPLGILVLCALFFLCTLSGLYSGVVLGAWLSKVLRKKSTATITWKNVTLGIIFFELIKFIPFIGWIAACGIFLAVFGSIIDIIHKHIWKKN